MIKPEEVDDLIQGGIIEHNDDVIQVQLDLFTYLIHACSRLCLVRDKYGKWICPVTNYRKSEDNTKHVLIDLLKNIYKLCIERFGKIKFRYTNP